MKEDEPQEDTFLPRRGQASDDPGEDYILTGIAVLLSALWQLIIGLVGPLWSFVRFILYEVWVTPKSGKT